MLLYLCRTFNLAARCPDISTAGPSARELLVWAVGAWQSVNMFESGDTELCETSCMRARNLRAQHL